MWSCTWKLNISLNVFYGLFKPVCTNVWHDMTVSLHLLRRCISNIRNIKRKFFLNTEFIVSLLTPLETDWQSSSIQSAMSCSLLALSSSGGRSVRMTWKACGRSVLFERRQPPQCSPLIRDEGAQRVWNYISEHFPTMLFIAKSITV